MVEPFLLKESPRCEHCDRRITGDNPHVACAVCNRDMCCDCISLHEVGGVCGLCFDRLTNPEEDHE